MSTQTPASKDTGFSSIPQAPLALVGIAFALGLAVEVLFYGHPIGISFPIWAALGIAAILVAGWREGVRPAKGTLALIHAVLFFAAVIAIRLEPLTVLLSLMATLLLFALIVRALLHNRIHRFGNPAD